MLRFLRALAAAITVLLLGLVSPLAAQATTYPIYTTRSSILHCGKTGPAVWLTFDDYGSTTQVNSILAVLKRYNVRAIFFPEGIFAAQRPDLIKLIRDNGHLLGNHSYNHPSFTHISDASVRWQIDHGVRGNNLPSLLRPPYGDGAFTTRLQTIARSKSYQLCYWTVDTRDWSGSSASTIIYRVKYGDRCTPRVYAGGIVLMHMHGRYTAAALPGVIAAVHARGLVLPKLH